MQGETESALDRSCGFVSSRMPSLLPSHQLVCYIEFFGVDFRSRLKQGDVLLHKIECVHVELGCKVIKRRHGNETCLRVVRSTPCARWTDIVNHTYVLLLLVGNV